MPIEVISSEEEQRIQIDNPKHIQYYHVENMQKSLDNDFDHPSTGETATHTAWVMNKILGMIQ